MKKLQLVIVFLLLGCLGFAQQKLDESIEKKIKDLVTQMTLEEKVGQMTQITLEMLYKDGKMDEEKVNDVLVKHAAGSLLNTYAMALPVEEWRNIILKMTATSLQTRLKIPMLFGIDAIHGTTYTQGSTLFPQSIGLAATRNVELCKKTAKITAMETRASGIRWNFAPVLDVGRTPLWSRLEETFGEDSYIATQMGKTVFEGFQEDGFTKPTAVAGCMKHYLGYSMPRSGKDRTSSYIPENELREYFLEPFRQAVKSGAITVMVNSSAINGVPTHCNKYLLTDVMKKELGFQGLIITDWEDIRFLMIEHKVAKDTKEATKMAINAGIDMCMTPYNFDFYNDLIALVKENQVTMERIDDAVSRILRVKFMLGLFDNPYPEAESAKNFGKPEYRQVAKDIATEAMVLLKNEYSTLPIAKDKKVVLAGPAANNYSSLHGSWSYSWQGVNDLYPKESPTIKEGLEAKIGKKNVICWSEKNYESSVNFDVELLKKNAANADYIVLCLGENSYAEVPGNYMEELTLPDNQMALAKAAIETGKPVILVLAEGRPMIVRSIEPLCKSIIYLGRAGSGSGAALADILVGDANPSGVLPFTYPKFANNIFTYDAPFRDARFHHPQWNFGFGLSYTTFEYSDIELSTKTLKGEEVLTISSKVKNTGKKDGKIAIDLFTSDLVASISPDNRRLRRFTKIELKAGESKKVEFKITKDDLSFINADLKKVIEEGEFEVTMGNKKAKFQYAK